jgi:2,3-dihydroxybenzoate-AMP ligase
LLAGCTPWPEDFAKMYREKGYWENITLSDMFESSSRLHPTKVAVVFGEQRITYAELVEQVERLAFVLMQTGLRPLDRVILQLDNRPEFICTFLALVKVGVIPVMALPQHRKTEISHFARHSGAVGYISADVIRGFDHRTLAAEIRDSTEMRLVLIWGEPGPGQLSLIKLMGSERSSTITAAQLAGVRPSPDEVALMLLSGGTTALPKLIPRTHNDYVYNCKQSGLVAGFNAETVYLALLPMAHNYSLGSPGVLATLAYGGRIVIAPGTAADVVFPLIERERVTVVCAGVPLFVKWLSAPDLGRHDLRSLNVLMNGGARLAPELRRRVGGVFGCLTQESFGTAEGLLSMTRLDDDEAKRFESSGAPISSGDEIIVVDDDGQKLPDGEPGELLCRGSYTIRGYYNAPEINQQAFTADGFYRMGDIVRKFGNYLYVEGRKKDLVNRGGEKISCEEIENHILANEKVEAACVVAMPDDTFGEKACAFIIARKGKTIDLPELIDFLSKRGIAKFKRPERMELVTEFPISPAGKILRRDLRAMIARRLEDEKGHRQPAVAERIAQLPAGGPLETGNAHLSKDTSI